MKKAIVAILILFCLLLPAFSSVKAEAIYYADKATLVNMCQARGLEFEGSEDELRTRIFDYEGLTTFTVDEGDNSSSENEEETSSDKYQLVVLNADSLEQNEGVVTLSGSVSIRISTDNERAPKELSASRIIVDGNLSKVTALGNALYKDKSDDAALQEISADVFTILWKEGSLFISGGTTSTERKNVDDKAVSFYTSGETLSYLEEGAILFEDGFITSNPKHAYSSISAQKLAILPGQDMFLVNALFNIGRVPIFYIPAFVFPGSRILGNPNFGFSSTKGAFVNTTFELFGSYPKFKSQDDSSSFTAILKSTEDNSNQVPVGYYYGDQELTEIEKWAKASGSYLTLMADAYTGNGYRSRILPNGGVHFGLDSNINLLDKKLSISFMDGLAVSSPVMVDGKNLRYYGVNTLKYNDHGFSADLSFPFYSDSLVLRDFRNRLSGFSIEPLLGNESVFPDDYTSQISKFSRTAAFQYALPSKLSNLFVSSLSISDLSINAQYEEDTSNRSFYGASDYYLSNLTLPNFTGKISGALYDFTWKEKAKKELKEDVIASEESGEDSVEQVDTPIIVHSLENPLLKPLFVQKEKNAVTSSIQKKYLASSLKYTVSETANDVTDYDVNGKTQETMSSTTSAKVTFAGNTMDFLSVNGNLIPSVTITNTEKVTLSNTTITDYKKVSLTSDYSVSLDKLGLKYSFAAKLYNSNSQVTEVILFDERTKEEKVTENKFEWTKDYITTHQLYFSKNMKTDLGLFSGSVTYVLPPLKGTLKPSLSWSKGKYSASLNWNFVENEASWFDPELLSITAGYKGKYLTVSDTMKYDTSKYDSEAFWNPMENNSLVKLSNGDYSISNQMSYKYLGPEGRLHHYFESINTSIKMNFLNVVLLHGTGEDGKIHFNSLDATTNLKTTSVQFWKGRVYLAFGLDSTLHYDNTNIFKSSLKMSPKMIASIAEFMDVTFSFTTQNTNLSSYYENNRFSFPLMWEDLRRSVDFFGDGRSNTAFTMKSASLEFSHYMEDWDLNCKYSTELVKSDKVYMLQPTLSIYLSWKTMPDLKVEENWRQITNADGSTEWQQY